MAYGMPGMAGLAAGVTPFGAFIGAPNPLAAGKAAAPAVGAFPALGATPAGACATKYGPVANVCQSANFVTQMIPVTTINPVPNLVAPQVAYGAPVTVGVTPGTLGAPVPGFAPTAIAPTGIAPTAIAPTTIAPAAVTPGAFGKVPQVGAFGKVPQVGAFGKVPQPGAFGKVPQVGAFGKVPQVGAFGAPGVPGADLFF